MINFSDQFFSPIMDSRKEIRSSVLISKQFYLQRRSLAPNHVLGSVTELAVPQGLCTKTVKTSEIKPWNQPLSWGEHLINILWGDVAAASRRDSFLNCSRGH